MIGLGAEDDRGEDDLEGNDHQLEDGLIISPEEENDIIESGPKNYYNLRSRKAKLINLTDVSLTDVTDESLTTLADGSLTNLTDYNLNNFAQDNIT